MCVVRSCTRLAEVRWRRDCPSVVPLWSQTASLLDFCESFGMEIDRIERGPSHYPKVVKSYVALRSNYFVAAEARIRL